jgi:DNA-binding NarL/FixJ family response regulator
VDTRLPSVSVAIIAAPPVRRHCRAILTRAGEAPAATRGTELPGARRLLQSCRPAAILLDTLTSPLRALFVLPTLKELSPASSVILIGGESTPIKFIVAALRRGASGLIAARDLERDLPKALRTVAAGEPWLSRQLGAAIVEELRNASSRATYDQRDYA